ncbi:hypothetical protein CEXT_766531 [Caerostris extrusa]|uniref:Uncharacterized protein n=1 Tax=Caerostris extrusa TaxID=172846 RepID=A0AAV4RYY0_CAEEX|nr:hypothetical protein CEXT_766531 [Caerostris extrusa]
MLLQALFWSYSFLQKFWMKLSQYVPTRVTPCVLTCLGLAINLGCCLTLLYYSPDAKAEAPSWVYVLSACGVFLYQTLDALDGKQAMKVQDTQIEEVYDHGCDAISTVFVCLTTAAAMQLCTQPLLMFLFFITSMLVFYSAHWQDHITHVMIFGKVDVSEIQFSIMFIHLLTAFYGQQFWKNNGMVKTIAYNIGYVLGNKTPIDAYVKVPRKTGLQIWNPVVPVSVLTYFAVVTFNSGLFEENPSIFAIAFGLAYAKLTLKLVIANVTYADMDIWDSSLVAPFLLCLNTYLPSAYMLPSSTALLCGLVYNMMDVARYFTYISWDLKEALDAYIFTLKYQPGHPKFNIKHSQGVYVNGLNNNEILANATKSTEEQSGNCK